MTERLRLAAHFLAAFLSDPETDFLSVNHQFVTAALAWADALIKTERHENGGTFAAPTPHSATQGEPPFWT